VRKTLIVGEEAWAERASDGADLPQAALAKVLELDPRDRVGGPVLIGLLKRAAKEAAKP